MPGEGPFVHTLTFKNYHTEMKQTYTQSPMLQRLLVLLIALPILFWMAVGCDNGVDGMDENENGNGNNPPADITTPYDTTDNAITITEIEDDDGNPLGIGYEDEDGDLVTDITLTNEHEYILDGYVYVNEGQTLNIEPGTVIRGKEDPSTDDQASALIVARGGQILADGEHDDGTIEPIIFTAEADDVDDPADLGPDDRQLWGGVIILGRAENNVGSGTNYIEGLPTEDERNVYGGDDDEDDSGIFRYVQIRHGGAIFGRDNEINGLTMGSVGNGTTIEYVEVFANKDDGFEWFGGSVNTRYLVAAFCGDDAFDYDEGFRGKGQFWFAIQSSDEAGSGGEHDGGTDPETGEPYSIPVIYNATYIGAGAEAQLSSNDFALKIRDNGGGKYYNSIFTEFSGAGVSIEDLESGEDSRTRAEEGDLDLENNIWYAFGDVADVADDDYANVFMSDHSWVADLFAEKNHLDVDPQLEGISRQADGGLNPLPASGGPAFTGDRTELPSGEDFYEPADYIGAFGDSNWLAGWTKLAEAGFLSE